jgi:hypothetical protein
VSAEEKDQTGTKDTPELSDEGKEKVRRMQAAYDDDRPTAVLPGTDNTITATRNSVRKSSKKTPTSDSRAPAAERTADRQAPAGIAAGRVALAPA